MVPFFPDVLISDEDIKNAFNKARMQGKSHLLVLKKIRGNIAGMDHRIFLSSVESPQEIVKLLKQENSGGRTGAYVTLGKVYDTAQDFEYQNTFSQAAGPLAPAFYFMDKRTAKTIQAHVKHLDEMYEYGQECFAYDNRPLLAKVFEYALRINNAPIEPVYPQIDTSPAFKI